MKGENLSNRLRYFAVGVLRLYRKSAGDPASKHVMRQLVRAATGGGANYEEARGAESRADFLHKLGLANKEVRESLYWLRLARDAELVDGSLDELVREADELVAILTSSINTVRARESTVAGEQATRYRTENGERERRTEN